jgi:hypothetical protein
MKLHRNQSGFSPIEIIIVIVMVGLTVAVGWLVYDRQKKNEQSSQTPATINSFEECVAAGNPVMESYPEQCAANGQNFINKSQKNITKDETADWLLYESPGKEYKVRLADGWVLYRYDKQADLATDGPDETIYKKGTKAVVQERSQGGRGGLGYFGIHYNVNPEECFFDKRDKSSHQISQFETSSGLIGLRYIYTPPVGTEHYQYVEKHYSYEFTKDGAGVCIFYDHLTDEKSKLETVEKVVKSFDFN